MNTCFLVDAVDSVESALTHLNDSISDIIVSDYQMNDMTGIDFLRQVRKLIQLFHSSFLPVWAMKKW
jgi:two-component SAPR family response regulator